MYNRPEAMNAIKQVIIVTSCDLYSAIILHHYNCTILFRATLEQVVSPVYQEWMAVMGQAVDQESLVFLVWMVSMGRGLV